MSYSCESCKNLVPEYAAFCPHCGAAKIEGHATTLTGLNATECVPRKTIEIQPDIKVELPQFNDELFAQLDEDDTFDEFVSPRRPITAYFALGLSAALVLGAVVFGGIVIQSNGADEVVAKPQEIVELVPEVPVVEPQRPPVDVEAIAILEETEPMKHTVVKYKESPLVPVLTHQGSRYKSVDKRAESVQLRLKHVAELENNLPETSTFAANRAGSVYEVVYHRANGSPFRIVDISRHDVKAYQKLHGETSKAILANLVADQLNQSFGEPDSVPQS